MIDEPLVRFTAHQLPRQELRPLMARCHLALGRIHRRTNQLAVAQDHLTTAATMLREMEMRFWLEQAEAEMAELR